MTKTVRLAICCVAALVLVLPLQNFGKEALPPALQDVGLTEHIGDAIPLDAMFKDSQGKPVRLGDYFKDGKPVLLNLVYLNCPMLCQLTLDGFSKAISGLPSKMDNKFNILTVSFDPRDTVKEARDFQKNYLAKLAGKNLSKSWYFLTGTEDQIRRLTEAVGFNFRFNPKTGEYAHTAVLTALSPKGQISRYLYGINPAAFDLRLALNEAAESKLVSAVDRILLFCYAYDPEKNGYSLRAMTVMRIGGLLTLAFIILFVLWSRTRKRHG